MTGPVLVMVRLRCRLNTIPLLGITCLQGLLSLVVGIDFLPTSLIRIGRIRRRHGFTLSVLLSKGVRSFLLELVYRGRRIAPELLQK